MAWSGGSPDKSCSYSIYIHWEEFLEWIPDIELTMWSPWNHAAPQNCYEKAQFEVNYKYQNIFPPSKEQIHFRDWWKHGKIVICLCVTTHTLLLLNCNWRKIILFYILLACWRHKVFILLRHYLIMSLPRGEIPKVLWNMKNMAMLWLWNVWIGRDQKRFITTCSSAKWPIQI